MSHSTFKINNFTVGPKFPCLIVGEIAQAHDGSLGQAHAYIDAVANAGADAIKFQTHIASAESTTQEPFRVKFSKQDATRYEYWQRMEFTTEQWAGLAEHANDRGILFLSSPFSEAAVALLDGIGMPAWKVASGEVGNPLLKDAMFRTGKPILLSTGMSSLDEIDSTVAEIKAKNLPFAVFQCTSKYPSPPEEIGLNMISEFRERYGVPVGLSDHSGKIYSGLAAATLGANLIEVHVTLSREMFGPDVPVSLTSMELRHLVEGVRFIEKAIANPVDKVMMAEDLSEMRKMFGKGLVVKRDIEKGATLKREDLSAKKPAAGIPADQLNKVIGKRLSRTIQSGEFIQLNDIEE